MQRSKSPGERTPGQPATNTGLAAVLAAVAAAGAPSAADAQQAVSPGTAVCVQAANDYYTVWIVTNNSGSALMVPNRTAAELNTVVNANGRGMTVGGDYNYCFGGGGTDGGDSDDGGDDG